MSGWHEAYVAMGSNLGDRRAAIAQAVRAFDEAEGVIVRALSSIMETTPVGPPGQEMYLNAVVGLATTHSPRKLLELCLAIEADAGRIRRERWGARTLDLDVLLYDDTIVREPGLCIPHPRLHDRAFVLEPLAEIAPDARHPGMGLTIRNLWDQLLRKRCERQ